MKELRILQQLKDELIADTRKVLQFDTVKVEAQEGAPFGKGNRECLQYVLQLCEKYGLETQNFDGYAGHAQVGKGDKVFGILGHLDVVPADEEDWVVPPFSAEIIDGNIYARGALDDKGPMMACLYAVRCLVKAGYKFKNTVRLIFGCDEESGMQCVKYYFTKVAPPDFGISPDGNFPVINREKGILVVKLNCGKLNENVISIKGGSRSNVCMDKCIAKINSSVNINNVKQKYSADDEVQFEEGKNCHVITVKGISSHGAQPDKGKNASWKMFGILADIFPRENLFGTLYAKLTDYNGKKWGVDLEDEVSGKLTCNIGIISYEGEELIITVDCRHPVTYTNEYVGQRYVANTPFAAVTFGRGSAPLYVPEESDLVQKLLQAYNKATGNEAYTVAIGGGTYSRCMKNCVAFGPEWPGEPEIIHQPNERISIDRLVEITKIYMEAIKSLCCE